MAAAQIAAAIHIACAGSVAVGAAMAPDWDGFTREDVVTVCVMAAKVAIYEDGALAAHPRLVSVRVGGDDRPAAARALVLRYRITCERHRR